MLNLHELQGELSNQKELPIGIRVGIVTDISSKKDIPVLLPLANTNGVYFEQNKNDKNSIYLQMQQIAFFLILSLKPELVRISVVNLGMNNDFKFVRRLNRVVKQINFVDSKELLEDFLKEVMINIKNINNSILCDYDNIIDYNAEQVDFFEPYHFIFIHDLIALQSENLENLFDIINYGSTSGVYAIVCSKAIEKYTLKDTSYIEKEKIQIINAIKEKMILVSKNQDEKYEIQPLHKVLKDLIKESGFQFDNFSDTDFENIISKIKPEYNKLTPKENFLKVPIGRLGRDRFHFELGEKNEIYHGLIAGQSGTGKSVLLNYIICQIMCKYSPKDVQFYLMDCKSGVEFNIFKNSPHVKALVSISNVSQILEPNIKLLETFSREMQKRAELFKKLSEQNEKKQITPIKKLSDYNKQVSEENKLPYIIMVIDEVQELAEDFDTKEKTKKLLKEFSRQGRSFGVHLILCSQGFGNYFYADIIAQMKLRIVLSMTTEECYNVLSARNTIPATKEFQTQPGKPRKAVYNTNSGIVDGNEIVTLDTISDSTLMKLLRESQNKYSQLPNHSKIVIDDSYDLANLPNDLGFEHQNNNMPIDINTQNSSNSNHPPSLNNWGI